MPKKRKHPGEDGEPLCMQIALRITPSLARRLETTAARLGLDGSNLLRLLLVECLPSYEERADRAQPKKDK